MQYIWVFHLCVQCSWSSVLAMDDDAYNRFTSAHAAYSILEKTFWLSWKVLKKSQMRNGHSRSLKVVRCCASLCSIYDFLLALYSNLTSIFNHSWDITLSLHIRAPSLFHVELEKDEWEWVDMLWCQGAQNIALSNHKLKCVLTCTVLLQCTPVPDGGWVCRV